MSEKTYPLLLKPVVKDYLWGGKRLKDEFHFETEKEIAAEGWMLAVHKDGTNTVVNGDLKGRTLDSVLSSWGYKDKFPILIKLIDAKDKLSVQVHPDNAYALEKEGEYGKTEMWYIVDCKPGARLIYGFNREISKAEFKERITDNTLDEVMNYVPVNVGDVFFISAGTLHAIGEGILIAEIQQNSNTTYRVSDYGRLGADGKPRELHVDKALDVTVTKPSVIPYGKVGEPTEHDYGYSRHLAKCEYFDVTHYKLDGELPLASKENFISLLVLDGNASVNYGSESIKVKKGDSVLIPKHFSVNVTGKAEIICSLCE